MLLFTSRYSLNNGWEKPLDPSFDSENSLLIIFGASDSELLSQGISDLQKYFPQSIWTGCSTAGEIYGHTLVDNTLVIALLKFEKTRLRVAVSEIVDPKTSFQVGSYLANTLNEPDLKSIFLLSDGLSTNGSELAKGVSQHLSHSVVITGGLAGDGDRFHKTWVMADKKPKSNFISAIALYGDAIRVSHGSRGGWDILGPEREVTKAEGNVLYTLDGQPALTLYKKYLGERAAGLPATGLLFPLAIRNDIEKDGMTVRTILSVNENNNSITFAGEIPQGSFVSLMRANFERLINGATDAVAQLKLNDHQFETMLTVAISCVGRRLVLKQRAEEELDAVLDGLPKGSALLGYYSYGELSPLASGRCDLHNQTMTLTSFWEK